MKTVKIPLQDEMEDKDRPVTLRRFPEGMGEQAFYEKDAPRFKPDWVATVSVPRRAGGTAIRYILINDRATLLWCGNIASLELHPFLHRAEALDRPTSIVFDLDPGEGTNVVTCAKIAFLLRDLLERAGLKSFPKMSGSKGLQLYVPLNTAATFAPSLDSSVHRPSMEDRLTEMAFDGNVTAAIFLLKGLKPRAL